MLHSVQDLEGYAIRATDGTIGHVKDFYLDDETWVIRYLVVETGSWLSSRKVLISPISIGHPDWTERTLPVSITKEQVKNSPHIDTDAPVARRHEMQYLEYYGYPFYWDGAGQADHSRAEAETDQRQEDGNPHLCGFSVLLRYHIEASDGGMGQVKGLLVDGETWAIRYLIVETSNWWFGHQVLISPQWIQEMSWPDATIAVNLTRQAVKHAPSYDSSMPLNRDQEMHLHQHHGRAGYWAYEVGLENPEYRARNS